MLPYCELPAVDDVGVSDPILGVVVEVMAAVASVLLLWLSLSVEGGLGDEGLKVGFGAGLEGTDEEVGVLLLVVLLAAVLVLQDAPLNGLQPAPKPPGG